MEKKELAEKSKELEPVIRIGKNGITEGIIEEIKSQLKKKKLIKIKFLKSAMEDIDKKVLAKRIAEDTNSELIDQVGFIVVLHKR